MSILTFFSAILGVVSIGIFFFLMRFKASSRQTKRNNRIKWGRYFTYKNKNHAEIEEEESSGKDADFKN